MARDNERFLKEGVESGEEFSGRGDECEFEGFSGCSQTQAEGFDDRVAADGVEGRHAEGATHRGTATGDAALAFGRAAVVIEGCQAGERGDGRATEGAQFGQMPEERGGGEC